MAQESVTQETAHDAHDEGHSKAGMLGPLLCWAVVFADIGTSVYYTPGILFHSVRSLAGFFVFLTLIVFVLLCLKYVEVTHRFPQGGGVVTVAAQALNPWFGAMGGMFILVDYFLTAAISCLSGIIYFSVIFPAANAPAMWITIIILVLLGVLNWVGISESAKVSLIGAIIAFISDLAILFTVFTHMSIGQVLGLFPSMFAGEHLTFVSFLTGFAGSFLAFSGLESISQLSPVMKQPHKKIAGIAMILVVITVGLTSPLLTMLSTLLLPHEAADPVKNSQLISLLAGHWGNGILQVEVAVSASALLVFASNTAIIGAYHVFIALGRMEFLPSFILKRNKLRGSPHYSIMLATGIPIVILLIVQGNIDTLGDMYAFGLLGAFTLTCLGLDIVRYREWRKVRLSTTRRRLSTIAPVSDATATLSNGHKPPATVEEMMTPDSQPPASNIQSNGNITVNKEELHEVKGLWFKIEFFLGILTTLLVAMAWSINLVAKPLATAFGVSVAVLGMGGAYLNYRAHQRSGQVPVPVVVSHVEERLPNSVLAILFDSNQHNNAVIRSAVNNAEEHNEPIVFLYLGHEQERSEAPRMMEIFDPYLEDVDAKANFGRAENTAIKAKVPSRHYIYLQNAKVDDVGHIWQVLHPHDTVVAVEKSEKFKDINPDRIRYELTSDGKVAHLLKRW